MGQTTQITPKKNGRPRKKLGRPPLIDERILDKLEQAYSVGCSDVEACLFAGIATATLYKYQDRNPLFVERKLALKEKTSLHARQTVSKLVKTDGDMAKWYLERRKRAEFGAKVEQDVNINVSFSNGLPRPKALKDDTTYSVPDAIEGEVVDTKGA